jgi:hypothetical protein
VRKLIAALLATLAFTAACGIPTGPRPSFAQADPVRIVVVGDSVTEQAHGFLGGWQGAPSSDVVKVSGSGWDLDDAEPGYAAAIANGVDITILALGPNDANPTNGGWDLYDLANFYDFLNTTVPTGTCVVVELPRHKSGFPAAWATQLDEARADLIDLSSPGGHTAPPPGRWVVLQDWRMRTAPHPELLASDGIHLGSDTAARERQDDYWDGARRCPTGGS